MSERPPKILLTGPPGCGKTTVIKRVIDGPVMPAGGFYTEEVRGRNGQRIGFDVVMLDGRRGPLARVGARGPRVGRYGVCLDFLEGTALTDLLGTERPLIVVDEIGKMECLSGLFRETVKSLLKGEAALIGTVAMGGSAFLREVRLRPDVELIVVGEGNREGLAEKIRRKVEGGKKKTETG